MCGLDDEEVGHPFSSLNHQDDRLAYFPKVFFVCVFVSVAKVITGSEGIFFVLINLVIFSLDLQINVSKINFDVKIHLCIVPISTCLKDCIHYSVLLILK